MSSLAHLFAGGSSGRSGATTPVASVEQSERLEELFAKPRKPVAAAPAPVDDTPALQALVGGRGRATTMAAGPVAGPTSVRRAGNQVDVLSLVMAVLAVIALAIASVIAWVVISSASPEGDALRTLTQSEAVLANETQAVNASISRVEEARAASIVHAQQLALPLEQLTGMSDEAALAAAETARSAYLSALEGLTVPPAVGEFTAPAVDEESLPSIGAAIDEVTTRSSEVSAIATQVDDLREELVALDRTFATAMATFAATVPASATAIVEENSDADESFREAVIQTADAVAASALATPTSVATLPAYSTAVTDLRDDQLRAEIAIAEQLAREEEERRRQEQAPPPEDPGTGTDPATGTDPVPDPPVDPPEDLGGG